MNSEEIWQLITGRAARFGDRNPQQFQLLVARLQRVPTHEVARGLLAIFTTGELPPAGSPMQELAGRLLAELAPAAEFDLIAVLRASLARYELSVEQFPLYLAFVFGRECVLSALAHLESEPLSQVEHRSLKTLRFWLSDSQALNNGP